MARRRALAGVEPAPPKNGPSMSTVSPELALVDPDLRASAIAGLPSLRPFAFLELRPLPALAPQVPRAQAVGVYVAVALTRTLVVNAAVVVAVALLVLLVNLFA